MNKWQKQILITGLVLFELSGLFPPWVIVSKNIVVATPTRPERLARPERQARLARPERQARLARPERPERLSRAEQREQWERAPRADDEDGMSGQQAGGRAFILFPPSGPADTVNVTRLDMQRLLVEWGLVIVLTMSGIALTYRRRLESVAK